MTDDIPPALSPGGEFGAYLHLGLAACSVIGMTVFASGNLHPPSKRLAPPEAAPPLESLDPGWGPTQFASHSAGAALAAGIIAGSRAGDLASSMRQHAYKNVATLA